MFGGPEGLVILVLVLVLFGGSQLPKLARNLGEAQKELRAGMDVASSTEPAAEPAPAPAATPAPAPAATPAPAPTASLPTPTTAPAEDAPASDPEIV